MKKIKPLLQYFFALCWLMVALPSYADVPLPMPQAYAPLPVDAQPFCNDGDVVGTGMMSYGSIYLVTNEQNRAELLARASGPLPGCIWKYGFLQPNVPDPVIIPGVATSTPVAPSPSPSPVYMGYIAPMHTTRASGSTSAAIVGGSSSTPAPTKQTNSVGQVLSEKTTPQNGATESQVVTQTNSVKNSPAKVSLVNHKEFSAWLLWILLSAFAVLIVVFRNQLKRIFSR